MGEYTLGCKGITNQPVGLFDTPQSYGWLSRIFHWGMAMLFAVQLASSLARFYTEDSAVEKILWPSHAQIGMLLLMLVVVRGFWGLLNVRRRPPHGSGLWGLAARVGHLALYGLMVLVPVLAVLRSYGSGRGMDLFGFEVVERTGATVAPRLDAAGDALHGELGWILFALVMVHAVAAIMHPRIVGTRVLHRMGVGTG